MQVCLPWARWLQALSDKLSGAPAMSAVLRGSLLSALTRLQQQAPACLAEAAALWLPAVAATAADGPHARVACVHTASNRGATCADCRQQLQVRGGGCDSELLDL
jgi:hypothetical protein